MQRRWWTRHCILVCVGLSIGIGDRHGLTDYNIDTGEPVLLPFRMSCYVLSNLVVTAGMLTPGLQVRNALQEPGTR